MDRLSERALGRTTLLRQGLLARRRGTVVEAIGALAGLQAQYAPSPYIALWSRLEGFAIADLEQALAQRTVVKGSLMRSTLHLVTADDFGAYALPASVAGTANWAPTIRRAGVDAAALHEAMLAYGERPRTVEELEAYLDELAPDDIIARSAPSGVQHVAYRAISARGGLVHVPPSGNWKAFGKARLIAARRWLGRDPLAGLDPPAAMATMVRRYLAACGPASEADVARWAGQRTMGLLRAAFDLLGDELRVVEGPDGRSLVDLVGLPMATGDEPAPPRFLARWDSVVLAYERRDRILPPAIAPAVVRSSHGDILPTFTVDGWIAGTWSIEAAASGATVRLQALRDIGREDRSAIADEAERLIRFAEPAAPTHHVAWAD